VRRSPADPRAGGLSFLLRITPGGRACIPGKAGQAASWGKPRRAKVRRPRGGRRELKRVAKKAKKAKKGHLPLAPRGLFSLFSQAYLLYNAVLSEGRPADSSSFPGTRPSSGSRLLAGQPATAATSPPVGATAHSAAREEVGVLIICGLRPVQSGQPTPLAPSTSSRWGPPPPAPPAATPRA
jgi:hypothetical protein